MTAELGGRGRLPTGGPDAGRPWLLRTSCGPALPLTCAPTRKAGPLYCPAGRCHRVTGRRQQETVSDGVVNGKGTMARMMTMSGHCDVRTRVLGPELRYSRRPPRHFPSLCPAPWLWPVAWAAGLCLWKVCG